MENAVQALKMVAAVLIFIIAITTTFIMFSKAKNTADAVITAQDKQKYLESDKVSGGILYTSSEDISSNLIPTMTSEGDRIVSKDDVIATLYRYSIEKYGVTIISSSGNIIARFDSNTESNVIPKWNSMSVVEKEDIVTKIKDNTTVKLNKTTIEPRFSVDVIEKLYAFKDSGGNSGIGASWYAEITDDKNKNFLESGIIRHINALITGNEFTYERTYI